MGPKLLAAFGAGMVVASSVFYFLSLRELAALPPSDPPVQPEVVSTVVPLQVIAEPIAAPPTPSVAPRRTQPASKKFLPVVAKTVPPRIVPTSVDTDLPNLDIAPEVEVPAIADAPLPPPPIQTVTLPAGTLLQIRLAERLASNRNLEGDVFAATLDQELVVNGWVIAEPGARVFGRIVQLNQSGRVKGIASMTIELTSLTTSDGQKIPLHTAAFLRKADNSKDADVAKIALGSVVGAVLGAAAGGGKGAAIGAASGGAAGVAAVLSTRGKASVLEEETRLSFRLDDPVTITERR